MSRRTESRRLAYQLAIHQYGIVTRRQLLETGVGAGAVRSWSGSGRLFRIFPGTYALGRPAVREESLQMAAVLASGRGAVLGGRTAASALGFGDPYPVIEVIRPQGPRRLIQGCRPHDQARASMRRGRISSEGVHRIGSLPIAGPVDVLIELTGRVTKRELRRYFLEAGRTGFLTTECLTNIRDRNWNFPGRSRLIRLVDLWDPTKGDLRSHLEAEFRLMCAEQKVPLPETNQPIGRFEVDAVWWDARLVVELDGRKFHADPAAHRADAEKTRILRALGFRVLRFTWEEITGSPEKVAQTILRELGLLGGHGVILGSN